MVGGAAEGVVTIERRFGEGVGLVGAHLGGRIYSGAWSGWQRGVGVGVGLLGAPLPLPLALVGAHVEDELIALEEVVHLVQHQQHAIAHRPHLGVGAGGW